MFKSKNENILTWLESGHQILRVKFNAVFVLQSL